MTARNAFTFASQHVQADLGPRARRIVRATDERLRVEHELKVPGAVRCAEADGQRPLVLRTIREDRGRNFSVLRQAVATLIAV